MKAQSRVGICISSLLEEHHGGPIPGGPPRQAEEWGRIRSQLVVRSVAPNMDTVFVLLNVDGGGEGGVEGHFVFAMCVEVRAYYACLVQF